MFRVFKLSMISTIVLFAAIGFQVNSEGATAAENPSAAGCDGCGHDHQESAGQLHDSHDELEGPAHVERDPHADGDHEGQEEGDSDHDHAAPIRPAESVHADDEHDHDEHVDPIKLDAATAKLVGIQTAAAQAGTLSATIRLTGKIRLNEDRVAHVVPYVAGIVQQATAKLGDTVQAGQELAVIRSRQLAEAKAACLAAMQRAELAASVFEREQKLWQQKVSSEQEFIQAKTEYAEAEIDCQLARQKLYVFGLAPEAIDHLADEPAQRFMQYQLPAPFDGVVIDKHITQGEVVTDDSPVFTVADLDSVWVDFDVFPKDLSMVHIGQAATIAIDSDTVEAALIFVSPVLSSRTQTATARVVLGNTDRRFHPGRFVTAQLDGKPYPAQLVVPKESLQTVHGQAGVFVASDEGYAFQPVTVGRADQRQVEIVSGLQAGQHVVTEGAFELKSKIVTSTLDSHAGHGH